MELVNKMELLKQLADKLNNSQWYSETEEGFEAAMSTLENAPTVDAIPVEWVEQRIKELDTELQSLYSRFRSQGDSKEKGEALLRCVELRTMLRPYETILSEWRKENAA